MMERRSFLRRVLGGIAAAVGVWRVGPLSTWERPEQLEVPMAWEPTTIIGSTVRVRLPQRFTIYEAGRYTPIDMTRDDLPPV